MNPRATIALFLVTLLAVGGLLYLRKIVPATRESAELRRYAAVFEPEEIEEIDIVRGGETVSLRRANGAWQMTSPVADRAAPDVVDRLLAAVRFLDVRDRQQSPDQSAVAEAGLVSPRLRLDLRGGKPVRLELGGNTALPHEVFARVGGSPDLLRIPDSIVELSTAPAESFRDPRLTQSVADDIEKFTVRRADGEMTLRRERGRWLIEKPVAAPADPQAVRGLLDALLGLRITNFSAVSPETSALPGQTAAVSMTPLGGGEALNLEIMRGPDDKAKTVIARFPPRGGLIEVDAAARQVFEVSPEALRDRSLGYVEPDAIDRVVLESHGKTLQLQREGENWADRERTLTIDGSEVGKLIDLFNETRVISFEPGLAAADCGLQPPLQRLVFSAWLSENTAEEAAGGNLIATIELGRDAGGGVFARAGQAAEIVTIPPELATTIRRFLERENQAAP